MAGTLGGFRAVVGDVVVVERKQVGGGSRSGEILEVLGEAGHEHYRVRWEDDRESVFYPGNDAVVRHQKATRAAGKGRRKP